MTVLVRPVPRSHSGRVIGTADRRTPRRWAALAVLCASLLMVGTDLTALHVAVPTISRELLPSGSELLWIVDGYALTVAAGLVTAGTLADRHGRRRVLLLGFAVFGLASAAAALSVVAWQLIGARVLLGVGGAMIMSCTPAVIRVVFPHARERTVALGLWVAAYSLGVSAGPLLGGLLLERFWWGSVFLVNLPVVAAALVGGFLLVPESKDPRPRRWDAPGAALSALGLGGLVHAVQELGEGGGSRALTWVAGAGGVLLLVAFVRRQRRIRHPLVDLTQFADRRFSLAAVCVMGCYGAYAAVLFLLTQRLQLVEGYSPLAAGLALVPLAAANALGATLAPRVAGRIGRHHALAGGLVLLGLALAAFSVVGPAAAVGAMVAAGLGAGVVMTLGADAMLGSAPPERAGEVGAIQETSFSLGAGLGLALLGTVLSAVYRAVFPPVPGATGAQWEAARASLGAAADVAAQTGGRVGDALLAGARDAFDTGFAATTGLAAVALVLLGAVAARGLRPAVDRSGMPQDCSA
jgi:DHA2 family multidrug resistance protein-like MFS transporter